MNAISIGELLRKRREAFGASIEEAAKWCDATPKWLEKHEAEDDLSVMDFERICRGLAVFPSELLNGESESVTRGVARFRSAMSNRPKTSKRSSGSKTITNNLSPADLRLLATTAEVGRTLSALLAMQDKEPPFEQNYNRVGISPNIEPWKQGYELGENARKKLMPKSGPIYELEYGLIDHGIHIIRSEFSTSDIEAASVWESNAVPVIVINSKGKGNYVMARRASLAHELCHLSHDGGKNDLVTMVDSKNLGNYEDAVEQRARGFSPAFLAPRDQVREWWNSEKLESSDPEDAVLELAQYWGLSFEGATWHAKNCELIAPEIAEALSRRASHRQPADNLFETKKSDFSSLEQRYSDLVNNSSELMKGYAAILIANALDGHFISLGRAKELLSWQ